MPKTILDDKELEQYNEEYREQRKEDIKKYQKNYREENKDYQKQRREENREYYRNYREANKDYHKEYNQKYYQANKAEIIEKYKQKIECKFCKNLKTKWNMSRHIKTCEPKHGGDPARRLETSDT
jgi:DNA repair photolyase